jgi:hypothetical protein
MSIQGEQQEEAEQLSPGAPMSDADAEDIVRKASPGAIRCRRRGRHLYEDDPADPTIFNYQTNDGSLVREMRCLSCEMAVKRQRWAVRRNRKGRLTFELIADDTSYIEGRNGEQYVVKGKGRAKPKQIGNLAMSVAFESMSLTDLRRAIPTQRTYLDQRKGA